MDSKRLFTTRMKPTADDLNYMVSDTENESWIKNKECLFDRDTIQTGLTATASSDGKGVIISAGKAFDSTYGKRIVLDSSDSILWDGSKGMGPATSTNRVDLVSIRHKYLDGTSQSRQFIDTDPTSSTYEQAYTSNVITSQSDYYELVITSGTGTTSRPPTSVPITPSGTIPLFTVNIISGTKAYATITANDISNNVFNRYRSNNLKTLRDVTKTFSVDTGWIAVNSTSVAVTTDKNGFNIPQYLQPNIILSLRESSSATSTYKNPSDFPIVSGTWGAYLAEYEPSTGTVTIFNKTGYNSRYGRVILADTI